MPQAKRTRFINRTLFVLAIGFGLFLIARGLHPLLAALGALLPLLPRLIIALRAIKTLRFLIELIRGLGLGRARRSNMKTDWLRMRLNPNSGKMEGEVVSGHYQGRSLDQLTLDELLHVLAECYDQDRHSAAMLETYLDHRMGAKNWRDGYNRNDTGKDRKAGKIKIAEAYKILGLPAGSNRRDVISAYRRLIQKLHPDRGGSALLSAQINKAKDLLLDSLPKEK
nr:MAG: DnaJ domain-containing protein [Candidatus Kentron sp. SD]